MPQVRPHPGAGRGLGASVPRGGGSSGHPQPWQDGASFAHPCLCPLQSPATPPLDLPQQMLSHSSA